MRISALDDATNSGRNFVDGARAVWLRGAGRGEGRTSNGTGRGARWTFYEARGTFYGARRGILEVFRSSLR